MINKAILLFVSLMLLFNFALAQMADKAEVKSLKQDYLGLMPANKPFSLIDLSRVKWSHSYSVMFFSGGGSSGSMGMYTGSMFYEISSSLSIDLTLGIAHNPGSLFNRNINGDAALYPAFNLDYHPSDNFRISVGFISHPGFYNPRIYYDPHYWWQSR